MKLSKALVTRKELVLKKNALEARLTEAQAYKVHLETKEVMERLYSEDQFGKMLEDVKRLRGEIEVLKKKISKGNQQMVPGHDKCVQDLVIEIGTHKDYLALLGQLRSKCQEERYGRQEGVANKTILDAGLLDAWIDLAQNNLNDINTEITLMNSMIEI